ncbi:Putative beta-lactamase-inhibitor-like, PepSY-like [Saccharicrinis carchari]|uniref:Beta-lactamase-inhibitor-like, PepSY-like n=1 Tax=Saccharicrinis carchari TaxID=1168039 RepID=A0A521EWF7_SACCC|nr:PepSY-like domain-containing protein [Saccharicrinis carchari]SMO87751.1 Putative beta-lactamase-inhibitor-like, PepSY-like [Saccharicrinis carchari]
MKAITIILSLIFITLVSCDKDANDPNEVVLTRAEIPADIKTYLSTHFASISVNKAVKETENGVVSYEIYLNGNIELEFDSNFNVTDIAAKTQLPNAVIPPAILSYVEKNYPSQFITKWELELAHQQIELNNGVELEFTMNGDFLRVDTD